MVKAAVLVLADTETHVDLLKEYHGHSSVRSLVADGYQVLTF